MATKAAAPAPVEPPADEAPKKDKPVKDKVHPKSCTEFDATAKWEDTYTSMLDAPGHPLAHLKGV